MTRRCITIGILAFALTLLFLTSINQPVSAKKDNRLRIVPGSQQSFVPNRVLVKFKSDIGLDHARQIIAALGVRDADELPQLGVFVLDLPAQADEAAFANALQNRPEVEFAELDRIVRPAEVIPNDPWYANAQGYLRTVDTPTAWSRTTGSSSVVIAILDTGVEASHEDLVQRITPGWNTYNNNSNTSDIGGHGTMVAGTAAATGNNGLGVASVCWSCKIMPIRISDLNGYTTYSNAASGITWASDHGAKVANLSYSLTNSATVTSAAKYMFDRGGVVVMASGNDGIFDSSADNPYVLTVGATDANDTVYSWSNRGNNLDLTAPGFVKTTYLNNTYVGAAGTSVAAPLVAGVAALVFSANANLTAAQVQDILKQSVDDLGTVGWDPIYGWGRINAGRAVSMASGGGSLTADTIPPSISFNSPASGSSVSDVVAISVSANDNVAVVSVTLVVDGLATASSNVGPYNFQLNTKTLLNGMHNFVATAVDAAGNTNSAAMSLIVNNVVDVSPPEITISSPVDGSKVNSNVSVNVTVSDNVAVVRVELYADGILQAVSTSAPFTTKWNTAKFVKGTHVLQCKAYDAAGNTGWSQLVSVSK